MHRVLTKPRYIPSIKIKVLAYIDQKRGMIVTEKGEEFPYIDQESFFKCAHEHDFLLFITSLVEFVFLEVFVSRGTVFCEKDSHSPRFATVRLRHDKPAVTVVQASSWGYRTASISMLNDLRALFDHVGLGVFTTPGSMGYSLYAFVQYMKYGEEWKAHRHIRSSAACSEFLEENKRGARIETFCDPDIEYLYVDELDMCNAYLHMYREKPAGKSYYFQEGDCDEFVWFVAYCRITIGEDFPYGLVGSKKINEDTYEELEWISKAGTYSLVLGKREVELLQEAGCEVTILSGYGWYVMTDDSGLYSDYMEFLRSSAPDKVIADLMKKVAVAGIGRDGMNQEIYTIVPKERRVNTDIPLVSDIGRVYDWFAHRGIDTSPKSMPHWYAHTTEILRVAMTELMYKFKGDVLAINTDGIYVIRSEKSQKYPFKNGQQKSGDIVRSEHFLVKFEAVGHVDARSGKQRHPGGRKARIG
jgi:hypothetical protein